MDRVHEQWLRGQHFALPGLQLAFDTAFKTVLLTAARRDRLDAAITEMAFHSEYTAARMPAQPRLRAVLSRRSVGGRLHPAVRWSARPAAASCSR